MDTVVATDAEPFTLAATILLILKTSPLEAGLAKRTTAVVAEGVKYVVVPYAPVAARIFGFAMLVPYRPKINEIAVAFACVTPPEGVAHVGAPPVFAVNTCPVVPFVMYAVVPALD